MKAVYMREYDEDPWHELANAVIVRACLDYRDNLLWLKLHRDCFTAQPGTGANRDPDAPDETCGSDRPGENRPVRDHRKAAERLERFFRSGWFRLLSDLDGRYLTEQIRKEVDRGE